MAFTVIKTTFQTDKKKCFIPKIIIIQYVKMLMGI